MTQRPSGLGRGWRGLLRGRYSLLGGALLLLAGVYPILGYGLIGLSVWTASFWGVLLGALYAVGERGRVRQVAKVLVVLAFAAGLAGLACYQLRDSGHDWIFGVFDGLTLLFLVLVTGVILRDVIFRAKIDVDHLLGAACAYVLLGLTFAYAMSVVDALGTGLFLSSDSEHQLALSDAGLARAEYLYFSFVTLSTLGYGDLAPITLTARLVAGAEAIVGQLFLTILVARLIGMHIAKQVR